MCRWGSTTREMSNALRFAILLSLCTGPLLAGAQVFRCTDTAGKVHFADHPCAPGQASREVKIDKHPAPPPPAPVQAGRMSPEAMEYEKARAEQRQKSAASQKRIDDAAREVRQIKLSNFNPGKCDAAHRFMAQMERRDPLLYKIDIDYIQASQVARLHCGN